jgi:hypothetical protein
MVDHARSVVVAGSPLAGIGVIVDGAWPGVGDWPRDVVAGLRVTAS